MNFLVDNIEDLGPIEGQSNNFKYIVSQGIMFYPDTYYGFEYRYEASLLIPSQEATNWIGDFKRTPVKRDDDYTLYNLYKLKSKDISRANYLRVFITSLGLMDRYSWSLYPTSAIGNSRIGNELLLDDEANDPEAEYTRLINYYKQITWNDFIDIIDDTRRNYSKYAS